MPKRANPFIDDYIPQSKIHVSLKQFNNNEDRLRNVYVKTLDLLFKGAMKTQHGFVSSTDSDEKTTKTTEKKNKMKQLFIGKNGTLLRHGTMVSSKSSLGRCACGGEGEAQCAYCERALCACAGAGPGAGCQHACASCGRVHCAACTLIGSNLMGSEVCVSCYS